MSPEAVFSTSQAIYTGLNGNANIPAPPAPFDLPALLAANQALSAANAAALDGGRKAASVRSHCKEAVVKILDQLAKYVQANCQDDMTIFLSSGFKAPIVDESNGGDGIRVDPIDKAWTAKRPRPKSDWSPSRAPAARNCAGR